MAGMNHQPTGIVGMKTWFDFFRQFRQLVNPVQSRLAFNPERTGRMARESWMHRMGRAAQCRSQAAPRVHVFNIPDVDARASRRQDDAAGE